jgi:hypothetical protein
MPRAQAVRDLWKQTGPVGITKSFVALDRKLKAGAGSYNSLGRRVSVPTHARHVGVSVGGSTSR